MIIDNFKEHFKKPSCSCGKNPVFSASRQKDNYILRNVTYSFKSPQPIQTYALGDSNGIVEEAFNESFTDPQSGGPELKSYLQHNYILIDWFNYQVTGEPANTDAEIYGQLANPFYLAQANIFGSSEKYQFSPVKAKRNSQFDRTLLTVEQPFLLTANTAMYFIRNSSGIGIELTLNIARTGCYCELDTTKYSR